MLIMLFGITNVGKTTIGELLAEKLGYSFFDLDEEIRKFYQTTLEQMNTDYPNDKTRHRMKGNVLRELVEKHQNKTVIAVTPLYHTEVFSDLICRDHVIAIELQDSAEHIFERLIFSDEHDVLYKDDKYKNKHKDYYIADLQEDIKFYANVFDLIKHKYYIDNKSPEEAMNDIITHILKE